MHAIHTFRSTVDYFVTRGSTVNVCSLDLSKAFDKMNHHGLFVKLMDRHIPVNLLKVLELWFTSSVTCVKWGTFFSSFYRLSCGVRQGGVLSPYLFAIYLDSVIEKVKNSKSGCQINWSYVGILAYADDILLIAPTVMSLQTMVTICEKELQELDMQINANKSACIRIGPAWKTTVSNIETCDGSIIAWKDDIKYLGVNITAGTSFACSLDNAKRNFYRAFNAIYGKVGGIASEEVLLHLFRSKCLPLLLCGTEVCPLKKSQVRSLDYVITNCFMKVFKTRSKNVVLESMAYFNFPTFETLVETRRCNFFRKYKRCNKSNLVGCIF